MARFEREYNGTQPGDPKKAAAALLHVATLEEPPSESTDFVIKQTKTWLITGASSGRAR